MKLPPEHVHGIGLKSATAYGGLGEKLLKQYGWKEGEGLGLQGTGIASAIKVLKKDDTIGVGGRQVVREKETGNWWQQSFDSAMQNLTKIDSDADSSDSDADDFDMDTRRNRDGTLASSTTSELKLERQLAQDPWGRFGGRNGKLARIRAQEAALNLAQQGKSESKASVRSNKRQKIEDAVIKQNSIESRVMGPAKDKASSDEPEQPAVLREEPQSKATVSLKSKKRKPKLVGEVSASARTERKGVFGIGDTTQDVLYEAEPLVDAVALPKDWWGAGKFVAGGRLGGLKDQESGRTRQSFTEDTQEQLYMKTHAAKTGGKKGLGVGQGKAIGHEWKGTKTVFEDPESEAQPQGETKSKSTTEDLPESNTVEEDKGNSPSMQCQLSGKTLRKLSKQILKQETQRELKLSKLAKRLTKQLPEYSCGAEFQHFLTEKVWLKDLEIPKNKLHI